MFSTAFKRSKRGFFFLEDLIIFFSRKYYKMSLKFCSKIENLVCGAYIGVSKGNPGFGGLRGLTETVETSFIRPLLTMQIWAYTILT